MKVQDRDILGIFCEQSTTLAEHQCHNVCVWGGVHRRYIPLMLHTSLLLIKVAPPGVLALSLGVPVGHMMGLLGLKDDLACLNYLKPTGYKQAASFDS